MIYYDDDDDDDANYRSNLIQINRIWHCWSLNKACALRLRNIFEKVFSFIYFLRHGWYILTDSFCLKSCLLKARWEQIWQIPIDCANVSALACSMQWGAPIVAKGVPKGWIYRQKVLHNVYMTFPEEKDFRMTIKRKQYICFEKYR